MWSDEQARRLSALQDEEARVGLTSTQREELASLLEALDADETSAMSDVTAKHEHALDEAREALRRTQQIASDLERVRDAQRALLTEATEYLGRLRTRRAALAAEARDVLRRTGTDR